MQAHQIVSFAEYILLLRFSSPRPGPKTLVDVGAHRGSFARPFALKDWRIIAFEPEPHNYHMLCERLSAYADVTCIAKAVTDTPAAAIPFYVSDTHPGIHSLKPFHETHHAGASVAAVRLDETLRDLHIDEVTILKIDIEGADFLALKSFDFAHLQPAIVMCEFMDSRSHKHFGYTHHDMAAYMQSKGYTVFVSEWAPVQTYASVHGSDRHVFRRCERYPLNKPPAWGNLICVPTDNAALFEATLQKYLHDIDTHNQAVYQWRRREQQKYIATRLAQMIPGGIVSLYTIHRVLRRAFKQ